MLAGQSGLSVLATVPLVSLHPMLTISTTRAIDCDITASYYSSNLSSTAYNTGVPVSLTYGTARASGEVVVDVVSFGGFSDRTNIAACPTVYHLTTHPDQTGLWGLGFQTLSASQSMPFLQGLYNSGSSRARSLGSGSRTSLLRGPTPRGSCPGGL